MICIRRGLRGLIVASLLSLALPAGVARAGLVLVKAETGLTLREKPESESKKLATLTQFSLVDLRKSQGEWAQVVQGKNSGWVLSKYLSPGPFVTVNADQLQIRRGPDAAQDVMMKVGRHYPLRVLDQSNGWLKVEDYEGDRGWASAKLVEADPYIITKNSTTNVRKTPGEGGELAYTAEKGVVFKALDEKDGWVHVKHADGDEGWISAKIVFGWTDNGPAKKPEPEKKPEARKPEPKKPAAKPAAKKSSAKPSASSSKKSSSTRKK